MSQTFRRTNFVAYAVKAADTEKDNLPGNLWLAKWDGTENRALTFGNKGLSHPRWSRDGKRIAFVSGRENENEVDQLWILFCRAAAVKRKNSPT